MTCEEAGSVYSSGVLTCSELQSAGSRCVAQGCPPLPRWVFGTRNRPPEAHGEEPEERPLAHFPGFWEAPGGKFMFNRLINDLGS